MNRVSAITTGNDVDYVTYQYNCDYQVRSFSHSIFNEKNISGQYLGTQIRTVRVYAFRTATRMRTLSNCWLPSTSTRRRKGS